MKKLLINLTGIFLSIPGAFLLPKAIGTPPGEALIFMGASELFGVFVLLVVLLNKGKLLQIKLWKLTTIAIISFGFGFLMFFLYYLIAKECLIKPSADKFRDFPDGVVYFPLIITGEVADLVTEKKGKEAAVNGVGPEGVKNLISQMDGVGVKKTLTTLLLIIINILFVVLTTLPFALLGFYVAQRDESPKTQSKRLNSASDR